MQHVFARDSACIDHLLFLKIVYRAGHRRDLNKFDCQDLKANTEYHNYTPQYTA